MALSTLFLYTVKALFVQYLSMEEYSYMSKVDPGGVKRTLLAEIKGLKLCLTDLTTLRLDLLAKISRSMAKCTWARVAELAVDLDSTELEIARIKEQVQDVQLTLDRLDEVLADSNVTEERFKSDSRHCIGARVTDGLTGSLNLWVSAKGALVVQLTNDWTGELPVSAGMYLQPDEVTQLREFLGRYLGRKAS